MDETEIVEGAHSPLGASSAERWMNCPGSVALIEHLQLPQSDEEEWRTEGITAHSIAAACLETGQDAWEMIHPPAGVTAAMAIAVQSYLDLCRSLITPSSVVGIEQRVRLPHHPKGYGTTDFSAYDPEEHVLDIVDYKHGIGIAVDVEWNPQAMYYGRAQLEKFPDARTVRLTICQPRAFHPDGPIRVWEISAEALCLWADDVLAPAMYRTETDHGLLAGDWCRFCPAKIVCPMLEGLFAAAAKADPARLVHLSPEKAGMEYNQIQGVKFYIKALEALVMGALNKGIDVPHAKLVRQKANRVWKEGAQSVAISRFGARVLDEPEFRSPAELEKLDEPGIKDWVHEWAYTPPSGLTVARANDKRAEVKVKPTGETFAGLTPEE